VAKISTCESTVQNWSPKPRVKVVSCGDWFAKVGAPTLALAVRVSSAYPLDAAPSSEDRCRARSATIENVVLGYIDMSNSDGQGSIGPAFSTIAALDTSEDDTAERTDLEPVQRFLERFGYLRGGGTSGEVDAETTAALTAYQEFMGLRPTGHFDSATREQMTQGRCALPDRSPLAFAIACSWEKDELTYVLDTGTADVAGQGELDAVRSAFKTWQALGGIKFREVQLGQNPDVFVDWRPADDPDLSMVGAVLAHADFPLGCSFVTTQLPKPIHFDDSEVTWSVGAVVGAFDVETVALHEIGHIIGLQHSSVSNAVMFASVSPGVVQRTLTADDIDGFRDLYVATVPSVVGMSLKDAAQLVRNARLIPQVTGASGREIFVASQSPNPDQVLRPGGLVTLRMARGIPFEP
jgi:Matrixin/Putative peptidoglycan binding domain/PASTA domain